MLSGAVGRSASTVGSTCGIASLLAGPYEMYLVWLAILSGWLAYEMNL